MYLRNNIINIVASYFFTWSEFQLWFWRNSYIISNLESLASKKTREKVHEKTSEPSELIFVIQRCGGVSN